MALMHDPICAHSAVHADKSGKAHVSANSQEDVVWRPNDMRGVSKRQF